MISQYYPNPAAPVKEDYKTSSTDYQLANIAYSRAEKKGIDVKEWMRRDRVIQELYRDKHIQVGDICLPVDPAGVKKYGEVRVTGIIKSYVEMDHTTEPWPSNDNPFVVSAVPVSQTNNKGQSFICTLNYLTLAKEMPK